MQITVTETINAPVAQVWQAFTDFPKMEERLSAIKKIEFLEREGRPEVGMKWRETRVMFGREATEEMWITEINENRNYVVEAQSHGTKYRSEYIFTDKGGATEVSMTFEGKPVTFGASVGAWLMFFFKGSVKKSLAADMKDLKELLESSQART